MRKRKKITVLVDRMSFPKISMLWLCMILGFGIAYTALHAYTPVFNAADANVSFLDLVYFSFVTATTIGYGDIVPLGVARLFAVAEGIIGLLIYGIVISKLVYYKQEVILEEVYHISFEEKLNRLRSSLYLFRSDIAKKTARIQAHTISEHELRDIPAAIHTFDHVLNDIMRLLKQSDVQMEFIRKVEDIQLELMLNSISLSAQKVGDLLKSLRVSRHFWKDANFVDAVGNVKNALAKVADPYRNHQEEKVRKKALEILEVQHEIGNVLYRFQ